MAGNRKQEETQTDANMTICAAEKKITCSGCSNYCYLSVVMKKGKVESVSGEGCRRGIKNAVKRLEK